ncbi:hypothetical protein [Neobacillus sp. YIM B06451]|uniref:hypothetical protein n=1 Tax=Neobacillus sp. YIM B06451 TaxID=3070994 RepID=UPI00292D07A4|nr:hypothetical protein [Neobacillus sp. YIM B06451]
MDKLGRWFHSFYPYLISLLVTYSLFRYYIDYRMPNFDKVLDGSITFSSIVVGFLGALLAILLSIKDSAIVQLIFNTKEKLTLKRYFHETFLIGFLVVIFSSIMHVLRGYDEKYVVILFYVWSFTTVSFIPLTYRIVGILMAVFFKANSTDARVRPGTDKSDMQDRVEREKKLRKNLSK